MLIIVTGLASILLVLAVAFMARMRSDSQETRVIVAEAQSRLMMHAALMYLQECSRIGWGDAGGETFGWTDIRDGGLGPRGQRPGNAAGDGSAIPAPEWWTRHGGWPPYRWDADDTNLPSIDQRAGGWPCPGTATRCPMAVCQVPPYATQITFCYNPVQPPVPYGDPNWDTPWNSYARGATDPASKTPLYVSWPKPWIDTIFAQGKGMLDPQPVLDTWGEFRNGKVDPAASTGDWVHERFDAAGNPVPGATQQLAIVPGSENNAWFRIYRETQADHDCIDNVGNAGTEWWDRVALSDPTPPLDPSTPKLRNWSVFIVTCGAGGTRGYRFWDGTAISQWESAHGLRPGTGRALEPVTAQESGLFPDQATFEDLLADSRILWFRCEWSGLESGARTMAIYNDPVWRLNVRPWMHDGIVSTDPRPQYYHTIFQNWGQNYQYPVQYADTEVRASGDLDESDTRTNSPKVYGGNIKWLQRLDRDPVLW